MSPERKTVVLESFKNEPIKYQGIQQSKRNSEEAFIFNFIKTSILVINNIV